MPVQKPTIQTPFNLTRLFLDFFRSEKFSGFLLIGCTALSLLIANSNWGEGYIHFWHQALGPLS
ncbi:MAG: Na+/H+ antiporter NhaA, partial [Chitinophagaceae bacterium]